jgi:carbon monoxide dehydrogenase subunit G
MISEGAYDIKASKQTLWNFITDPAKLSSCLPDVKSLEMESVDKFKAVIRVGVGFIKSDFKFRLEIVERKPTDRVRLVATGSGSGSNVTIDTAIELTEIPEGVKLSYKANILAGGIMASLGQRVLQDAADKIVANIFERIRTQLS